jgi:antitoxin (DNA-binding transcriptional repressor) of toxin-antitoxin stability system
MPLETTITIEWAEMHFDELLIRIAQGESFVITQKGLPLARFTPI